MAFSNAYNDNERARAYATLGFSGTYHLAFRDLPTLLAEHVRGRVALDFGCGTGRSTRFLSRLGFDAIGIDIAAPMIDVARAADPDGRYLLVEDGDYRMFEPATFDLVLSTFAFDNIPDVQHRTRILGRLGHLLRDDGRIVLLGCTPEIYVNEWASFSTKGFPGNRQAKSGDEVHAIITDIDDRRPVVDLIWFHDDYLGLFAASGLELIAHHRPIGREDEPYAWVSETSISPWSIYVLAPTNRSRHANRCSR
jgi:SAM-dependent methyltransferase